MKKIMFFVAIATALLTTSCSKEVAILTNTPVLLGVDQQGYATWQLPNGSQTRNRAIIIPAGNTAGMRLNGECIITAPPIKPTWERNQYGQWAVSGFYYNEPEFTAYKATAWVATAYNIGGVIVNPRAAKVSGAWGNTPNPASYANAYTAGTLNVILGIAYSKTLSIVMIPGAYYQDFIIN